MTSFAASSAASAYRPAASETEVAHVAPPSLARGDRWAGLALMSSALASIAFMVIDASNGGGGTDAQSIMQGMVRSQGIHQAVHIGQMACIGGLVMGHVHLGQRLGLQRLAVKAGLMGYLLGAVLMLVCTVIDGLILADVAGAFVQRTPELVQIGWSAIKVGFIALTDLARVSWIFMAAGTLALSAALLAWRGLARKIGVVGLAASALQAAAIVSAGNKLPMEIMLAVLALQAVWYLCAAWLLWKGVPGASATSSAKH